MATFVNQSRNIATFKGIIRHGTDPRILDIQDLTFNDVLFEDGTQLKDATFAQLVDQVWTNINKSASPVFTNQTRN